MWLKVREQREKTRLRVARWRAKRKLQACLNQAQVGSDCSYQPQLFLWNITMSGLLRQTPAGQRKPDKTITISRRFPHSQALGGAAELNQSGFQPPRVSCGKTNVTKVYWNSVVSLFLSLHLCVFMWTAAYLLDCVNPLSKHCTGNNC